MTATEHGKLALSWKYVFNADLKHFGAIAKAREYAANGGYKYMSWNDVIYNIEDDGCRPVTVGVTSDMLK